MDPPNNFLPFAEVPMEDDEVAEEIANLNLHGEIKNKIIITQIK